MQKLKTDELGRKTVDEFKAASKLPLIVVLDNIRSLHNIGSFFRTADAFLVEELLLCGIAATPPHREIHKTALGATEAVAWKYFKYTTDAVRYLQEKNYRLYAVEQTQNSIPLQQMELSADSGAAFFFGNEVSGVQQVIVDLCDTAVEIPQEGTKHSFNVAVSGGIVLWEYYRRFTNKKSR